MKSILIFVSLLTVVAVAPSVIIAQYQSGTIMYGSPGMLGNEHNFIAFSEIEKSVQKLPDEIKSLKKFRALTRAQYKILLDSSEKSVTPKDIKSQAQALRDLYYRSEIQRETVARIREDIVTTGSYSFEKLVNWTPAQYQQLQKWKNELCPEILKVLKDLNKERPSDFEIEELFNQYASS